MLDLSYKRSIKVIDEITVEKTYSDYMVESKLHYSRKEKEMIFDMEEFLCSIPDPEKTKLYTMGFIPIIELNGRSESWKLSIPLSEDGFKVEGVVDGDTIKKMKKQATKCQFAIIGKGTYYDPKVRRSLEIEVPEFKDEMVFQSKDYKKQLMERIREDLFPTCKAGSLNAKFYRILVYSPGDHFKAHIDVQKEDGHVGTMSIELKTEYKGGNLVFHIGESSTVAEFPAYANPNIAHYAAWNNQVLHSVEPLQKGHRVVLIFNLMVENDANRRTLENDAGKLGQWFRNDIEKFLVQKSPGPRLLLLNMTMMYSQDYIEKDILFGKDRTIVSMLEAAKIPFGIYFFDKHNLFHGETERRSFRPNAYSITNRHDFYEDGYLTDTYGERKIGRKKHRIIDSFDQNVVELKTTLNEIHHERYRVSCNEWFGGNAEVFKIGHFYRKIIIAIDLDQMRAELDASISDLLEKISVTDDSNILNKLLMNDVYSYERVLTLANHEKRKKEEKEGEEKYEDEKDGDDDEDDDDDDEIFAEEKGGSDNDSNSWPDEDFDHHSWSERECRRHSWTKLIEDDDSWTNLSEDDNIWTDISEEDNP